MIFGANAEGNLASGGDTAYVFVNQDNATIYGSNETIRVGNNVTNLAIHGSNDRIDAGSHDSIYTWGQWDTVSADDSTIDFVPTAPGSTTGDYVEGSGDTGYDWAGWLGPTGGDSGLGSSWGSSGAAGGRLRTTNAIAQYDLGHGHKDAAAVADVAWARAEQALSFAYDGSGNAPSPFNGIRWSGPVIVGPRRSSTRPPCMRSAMHWDSPKAPIRTPSCSPSLAPKIQL